MLHYETIDSSTLELLKELQSIPILKESRLVGGTALALQIGHRKSIDLDIFGRISFSDDDLNQMVSCGHDIAIVNRTKNIKTFNIDNVKVDFVNYGYKWIDEVVMDHGIRLASIKDIAAMKVTAIIGRGTKKDFIDLFYLLKRFSLEKIFGFYQEKYPDGSMFLALKSLSYFNDADSDPMPYMFTKDTWDNIKDSIKKEIVEYVSHI